MNIKVTDYTVTLRHSLYFNGFDPRPGRCVCFLEQETFTPQKVLVIPRNRWLRLNMTEKLFTGTLNHNKNKTKKNFISLDK